MKTALLGGGFEFLMMLGYHKSVITKTQDEIFKKMSADKKIRLAFNLSRLVTKITTKKSLTIYGFRRIIQKSNR